MNKAVIYISGTTNETVNNMIAEVLERYCEKHEYEIVALLGENSQAGMSMPMKYSFIGMAEVEDIDTVVTLSSAMVGTTDDEIMETIDLLAHYGITVETAKEDMSAYYDALGSDGYCGCDDSSMDDTQIIKELDKLINEPIAYISGQIDAFEQKRIEEKRELINEIYLELVSEREDIAGYAELNRVYDSKWENASTSKKTIQEAITSYLDSVDNDIAAIESMESEYEAKALMRYKETGVLSDALLTIRQWEKQKEEILKAEEEKQAEAEADEILDAPEPIEEFIEPTEKNDIMKIARYEVKVDPFQQTQLECYMQECGIQYRRLD